jgi:hypothetical protein
MLGREDDTSVMGITTSAIVLVLAAPSAGAASVADLGFQPLTLRVASAARPPAPLPVADRAGNPAPKLPDHLGGWPIGWGLGTRQLWLDYARGRRIWRLGVGLLSTGVSGLAVSLSLGTFAVIFTPRGPMQNLSAGLLTGFSLASVILTYVGGSLMVKGKRIRDQAVLDILRFRTRSGAVQAEVQLGLGGLQLGGRF